MSIFSRIKQWLTGSSKSQASKARTASNYGGGGSRSVRTSTYSTPSSQARYRQREDEEEQRRKEQRQKQEERTASLAEISKRTDSLSSGKKATPPSKVSSVTGMTTSGSGKSRVVAKIAEKSKNAPPDPKVAQAKKSREDTTAQLQKIAEDRKAYNKATGDRYNVDKNGLKARQAQKSQAYDVEAEKYETKAHPVATSAGRGAVSGVTFGASELMLQRSKNRQASGAEETYQQNKSAGAEIAGEVVGSLVGFGLTEGAATKLASKVAPNVLKRGGEKAVQALARDSAFRTAAKKEAERAGVAITDEVIDRFAMQRAQRLVNSIGSDMAINVTTGGLMDVNQSVRDSYDENGNFSWGEFGKNMAVNAGLNLGLGGAVTVAPALRTSKGLINIRARDDAVDLALRMRGERGLDDLVRGVRKAEASNPLTPIKLSSKENLQNELGSIVRRTDAPVASAGRTTRDALSAPRIGESIENRIARNAEPIVRDADEVARQALDSQNIRQEAADAVRANAEAPAPNPVSNAIERISETDPDLGVRLDALKRELDELNPRIAQGDAEAIARQNEIRQEASEIISDYRTRYEEPQRVEPPIAEEAQRVEPPAVEESIRPEPPQAETVEPPRMAEDEFPYEGTPEAEEMSQRIKESRQSKTAKPAEEKVPNADEAVQNGRKTVNEEIRESLDEKTAERWSKGEPERYTAGEAENVKALNERTNEEHTKQGATTIGVGMGDKRFEGAMRKAIEDGDMTINVYHDKENYEAGAKRVLKYAERGELSTLIDRFDRYSRGGEKVTSIESRNMLYDILAAVDYANSIEDKELAERLFMSATKAGAELTSVSGLSLRQWQKIAMSSPDYRAKAAKAQIEAMFNKSRGFRKKYGRLEGRIKPLEGKGKLSATDEAMPGIDDFIKNNPEDTKGLKDALDALANAKSKEEVEQAASHAILEARKIMPVTAFDQLTQWRYVAMLSAPTTHIKNIVGNIYSGTLGQTSGAIGSAIENHLIRSGKVNAKVNLEDGASVGSEYLKSSTGYSLSAAKNSKIGVGSGIRLNNLKDKLKAAERELKFADDSAKEAAQKKVDDLQKQVAEAQKTFDSKRPKDLHGAKAQELFHSKSRESLIADAEKWEMTTSGASGKLIGKASKLIGGALETSDAVAVESIYRETAEKILRANDYEKWVKLAESSDARAAAAAKAKVKQIEDYAAQHGAYRAALDTYRNYNAVASWMNKTVQNTLYNADAAWYKKAGGFMLHAVMPFTKVPTNILKRSADYSPIGLIQGKKMLNKALESGDYAEINKAVERLSEGLVGTGIASLGLGMGMIDPDGMTITTRLDRNDAKDKAKKDRGYMDYSVRFGNRDFTLEWATPTASTFFTGVEAGRMLRGAFESIAVKHDLEFNPWESFDTMNEILSTIIEPNLQLTMFQGINSIIEDSTEQRYGEANINPIAQIPGAIAKNYMQSLTPSLMSRLSRAFAPYDYYISGSTNLEYRKNLMLSKIPGLSARTLEAKTDAWGNIKNEKTTTGEKVASAAITLFSPANVSKVTWDETDEALYKLSEETGNEDFLPKVFYDYKNEGMTFGKNKDTAVHVDLSNNDAAQYNIAKGKAGSDAMHAALESVIFNRWSKDSSGHYTIEDPNNYTAKQKADLIAKFNGKGTKDVVEWIMQQPQFKNATEKEQIQVLKNIVGNGTTSASMGAKRAGEWAVAQRHGMSEPEYDYRNEVQERVQKNLDDAIAAGVITYEMAVAFARDAGKTYYRTDADGEEGGTVTTYYNKAQMMEYLNGTDYTEEQKAALYNAFKAEQTKEYGSSSGYRRYGRRRYGYRRRGGSSSKAKVPAPKTIKASSLVKGEALVSKKSKSSTSTTTPKLERVKAKIDLPEAKW